MSWGRNHLGRGTYESFDLSPDGDGSGVVDPVKERAILVWAQTQVTAGKGFEGSGALPKLKEALGLTYSTRICEEAGQGKSKKPKSRKANTQEQGELFAGALAAKLGEGES